MALPSYYTPAKPYAAPKVQGQQVQSALYSALAAGNAAAAQPPVPSTPAPGSPRTGATLPYDEFGLTPNKPAMPLVGQTGPAPAAPAATSSSGGGAGGGGGGGVPSFEDDPILARTKALWARNVSQAETAALAGRKQAEIGYGYDPNYTYADQTTQQAAQQNAFSDLANLLYNHTNRWDATDENLNKGNLFYSGERAKQLGREGRQYTLEQSTANQGFQSRLAAIGNALLQTKMAAQEAELQAQENAYNRALQFALQYGTGFDGGGGAGGGGAPPSNWGGFDLAPGAKSFAGAGQQEAPNAVQFHGQGNPQPSWGGWGAQGPGLYVAQKFPPTTPGGGSDTRWVKVG